ncbi:MAG: hypothetical protein NVS1B7_2600 [Candidatus Saccharimonadales bacterium]
MGLLSGISDFIGLDIGTTGIRVVQVGGNTAVKTLIKYAYLPVDPRVALSDAKTDQQKLAEAIKQLFAQAHINSKNVAVNLPSQRVFTTVVDFDRLNPSELKKTIQYQADSLIPTPIDQSKLDWSMIGDSPADKTKVEVLLSSVPNEYSENRLELLESIGLNVIAFEPDNLAMCRALVAPDAMTPQMVIDIGNNSTDIVVIMNGAPRLCRSIPTGAESIIKSAMQNLNIDQEQASQFVFKFGLSKDKLEGQIYQAIIGTVDILINEIDKSIKFFQTRYVGQKLERIIVTGGASAIPEFPVYLANKFALNVEIGNSWRNIAFSTDRQNELLAVSNHFSVAAGLAERHE